MRIGKKRRTLALRYKVKVNTLAALDQVVALIEHAGIRVDSVSRRFHFLAIENPSNELVANLKTIGAQVIRDPVYEIE